jgi:hypothetical protein
MQHRFVSKVALDEALRDRADLAPAHLDRDLGLEPASRGLHHEGRKTDAAAFDAHRLAKQHETGALVRQGTWPFDQASPISSDKSPCPHKETNYRTELGGHEVAAGR